MKTSVVYLLVIFLLYLLIMPSSTKKNKVTSFSRELAGITQLGGAGGQYSKESGSGMPYSFNVPDKSDSVQYEEFISFEAASAIEDRRDEEEERDESNDKVCVVGNRLIDTSALSHSFQGDGPLQCRECANDASDALLAEFSSYLESINQFSKGDAQKLLASFKEDKSDKIRYIKHSCSRDIVLEEQRTGIASALSFSCYETSEDLTERHLAHTQPAFAPHKRLSTPIAESKLHAAAYEHNVRMVIAGQTNGSGGEDMMSLLGFLDIPGGDRIRSNTFRKVEKHVGIIERQVTKEGIRESLIEEIKCTLTDSKIDFDIWKNDPNQEQVKLAVSFDEGWQARGSGGKFSSLSGHAVFIGKRTDQIIAVTVSAKRCATCDNTKPGEDPPPHECSKNHEGSSSSMEPLSCLRMLEDVYNTQHACISLVVTDDDSSTEANCKHSWQACIDSDDHPMEESDWPRSGTNNTKKKDYGKLPIHIPEPKFVADPGHRIKIITKALFKMMKHHGKKNCSCTDVDCYRVKRYFGYFIKKSRGKPFEEFRLDSKAVIEHLFNDHTYCSKDWCPVLKAQDEKRDLSNMNLKYRSKTDDKELYKQMTAVLAKYLTDDMLQQMNHPYDSQKNEAFNKSVAKYAPKDRTYSMTMSLTTRVGIAAGVSILGWKGYWERVFAAMGIKTGEHTRTMLERKDKRKAYKEEYVSRPDVKRARSESSSSKWRESFAGQIEDKKSGVTYKSGVRANGEDGIQQRPKRRSGTRPATISTNECAKCKRWDHQRISSQFCPDNNDDKYDTENGDADYFAWEDSQIANGNLEAMKSVAAATRCASAPDVGDSRYVLARVPRAWTKFYLTNLFPSIS
jgi:hypothetical protein